MFFWETSGSRIANIAFYQKPTAMRNFLCAIVLASVTLSPRQSLGEDPTPHGEPSANAPVPTKPAVPANADSPTATAVDASAEGASAKPAATTFTPPFPHRDEFFQPPNHKGLTKAQKEEVRTEIVLRGFANVDGLKVILAINGKPFSLGVGENQFGIEVVNVAPPQVTLQRGRVRWTETLYPTGGR